MTDLLQSWQQVAPRFRRAEAIALFLDFDGTLVPLRARPEDVRLNSATRRALLRLTRCKRVRMWVISGRRLADVRERIGVPGVHYLGLHGWEGNGGSHRGLSLSTQSFLRQAIWLVSRRLNGTAGLRIEDKSAAFALHYRGAPDQSVSAARAAVRNVLETFTGCFRVIEGDAVLEVLPRELAGKGVYARREWLTLRHAVPIYLGNDASDEPAFAALSGGVTARVGRQRRSRARFHLSDPLAVRMFLEKLGAEMA
jgi:trehalose-phosphatase